VLSVVGHFYSSFKNWEERQSNWPWKDALMMEMVWNQIK